MSSVRVPLTACYFLLAVLTTAGCSSSSDGGDNRPPPPPPDTTAPTVSDVDAGSGALSRTVTLSVTASDNVAVSEVRFFVDGELVATDMDAPYSTEVDTGTLADGEHTLSAEAEDAAGNLAQSGEVTVSVQNTLQFSVAPNGDEEVPPQDSAGSAAAELTVNIATGAVSGTMTVTGITPTAAHIHDAFAGSNGPVLVPLDQDGSDPGLFSVPADAMLDTAGVDDLLAGGLYLNVHTAMAPGGEIRGQILPEGFELYFTDLGAKSSVPVHESPASGRAGITFDSTSGTLVVQALTSRLDEATDAHVHEGYAGENGPVLIGLTQDIADPGRWFVENGELNAAGVEALNAGRLYINVHSDAFPGGEIRGQILPAGISVFRAPMSGTQEIPLVDTDATGIAFVTYNEADVLLTIHATTSGLEDASAAHLHTAVGGVNGGVAIPLTQDGSDIAHWFANEAAATADVIDALFAAGTYVNVHSPDFPGGEIRGQVVPDGFVFASGRLEGRQEVPAVASEASGMFAVTADIEAMTVTAHAHTTGADDAVAAHLHEAYAGTNGGVAVGLSQEPGEVTHWLVEDAALTADQLAALLAGGIYVNVHTPDNPGGEVRGQVAPEGIEVFINELTGDQVVPPVMSAAGGLVATTTNVASGDFLAVINTSGADDATTAGINLGSAGENGDEILPLAQTPMLVTQWSAAAALDEAAMDAYLAGNLYALVTTPANADGELRGQVLRGGVLPPPPDTEAPTVTLDDPGSPVSGTVTLEADAGDDTGVVEVRFLADGVLIEADNEAPYAIEWDTTAAANGEIVLTAEAEDEAGNVGTSADVTVTVDNTEPVSFAAIQSTVFGPRCSGCHTGPTGGALPGGMNLSSAAESYAALVGVPSIQQPSLDRVEPGNPDDSYLIRKLEGGPGITGTQMPQGGPFLSQSTIDEIRQWISDGAPNN